MGGRKGFNILRYDMLFSCFIYVSAFSPQVLFFISYVWATYRCFLCCAVMCILRNLSFLPPFFSLLVPGSSVFGVGFHHLEILEWIQGGRASRAHSYLSPGFSVKNKDLNGVHFPAWCDVFHPIFWFRMMLQWTPGFICGAKCQALSRQSEETVERESEKKAQP